MISNTSNKDIQKAHRKVGFFHLLLSHLLYSNTFLALGAALFALVVQPLLIFNWPLFLGAVVFVFYGLCRQIAAISKDEKHLLNYEKWTANYWRIQFFIQFISALYIAYYLTFQANLYTYFVLIIAGILAVAYIWPFPTKFPKLKLRYWGALKAFWVALVWVIVVAGLLYPYFAMSTIDSLGLICSYFCWIWSLALILDIRDAEIDTLFNQKNMATIFGTAKTHQLCLLLFVLSACSLVFSSYSILTILTVLISGVLIQNLSKKHPLEHQKSLLVDLSVLLYPILLLLSELGC